MKPLLLAIFLVAVNAIAAPVEKAAEDKSVNMLVKRIRDALPDGWKVSYEKEYAWLEIARDKKVPMRTFVMNGPPDQMAQEPVAQEFILGFRIAPLLPVDEYQRLRAKNLEIEKDISALYAVLDKRPMTRKFDSFIPRTDEDKELVERYAALKRSRHALPDYYFHDLSLRWEVGAPSPFGPFTEITDEAARNECARMQRKILGLLSSYEPTPPNDQTAPRSSQAKPTDRAND